MRMPDMRVSIVQAPQAPASGLAFADPFVTICLYWLFLIQITRTHAVAGVRVSARSALTTAANSADVFPMGATPVAIKCPRRSVLLKVFAILPGK